MNILQVINVRWFNAEAAYAISLSKGLVKMGHNVIIAGLSKSPVIYKAIKEGIRVYETDDLNSYNPLKNITAIVKFIDLIDTQKIDVINSHRSEGYPLLAFAVTGSQQKPVIIRTRGDVRNVRSGFLNRLFYTGYADGIIASGEIIKKGLIERLGLYKDKIDVIYAAVDTERFRPFDKFNDVRKELGVPSNSPLLAVLGRIDEVKGHKYFIEAASLILKEHPLARFLIIAKEIDEGAERLRVQIRNAQLEGKVLITGFREDISDIMASCDLGVVTSIGSEANCRVVLEWMAMGKPVVGTTVGVIPEVLRDGGTGYLVPPKDSTAIAGAAVKLLRDRKKAASFGNRGRELAESVYNEELFVEKTLVVYRKAIEHRKKKIK